MLGQEISEFGHILSNDQLSVVHVDLPKGKKIAPHDHKGQDIFFSVVKGQVKATLNESTRSAPVHSCASTATYSSASKPS